MHSCVYFVSITVCDLIIVHIDWSYSDLFASVQCYCVLSVVSECLCSVRGEFWVSRSHRKPRGGDLRVSLGNPEGGNTSCGGGRPLQEAACLFVVV